MPGREEKAWDPARAWDVEGAWAAEVWGVEALVGEARSNARSDESRSHYLKAKEKEGMKLVDIMPIEKWVEIEQEINRHSVLIAG